MRKLCWAVMMCAVSLLASAQEDGILYKASMIQAAPGKLLELIDLEKKIASDSEKSAGDPAPVWMRHSQGDRWDLLIISPLGIYAEYYRPERTAKREKVHQEFREKLQQDIAWQE